MWNRGNCALSKRETRTLLWASNVETVEPAGPPPITATSTLEGKCAGSVIFIGSNRCEVAREEWRHRAGDARAAAAARRRDGPADGGGTAAEARRFHREGAGQRRRSR